MKFTLKKLIKMFIPLGFFELRSEFYLRRTGIIEPLGGVSPRGLSSTPPPPNTIPDSMLRAYSLNGRIPVLYSYRDSRILDGKRAVNTRKTYEKKSRQIKKGRFYYYGKEGAVFFDALKKYPLRGKSVIVWGLAGCNCEAMAVCQGAKQVYVVDYNKPVCEHERIVVLNHKELGDRSVKADFAFSYSSFEHDGLGRYGDPLSPDGDIRAMQEAYRFLNTGGILLFGVPLGKDCLVWNGHRIYGKNRLPLLLKGWQLLDVFSVYEETSPCFPFDLELGKYIQNILVLKKIENDFPPDEYLMDVLPSNAEKSMRSPGICERINKIVYEYKKQLQISDAV